VLHLLIIVEDFVTVAKCITNCEMYML